MKRATGNDDRESRTAAAYLPTTPDGGDRLILRGARLIDGTGGEVVADAEIEVDGGRIVYAGPARRCDESVGGGRRDEPTVTVVDLTGKTILPGFIDAHVHLGLSIEDQPAEAARFDSERVFRMGLRANQTLMAGVTTVRDLGGIDRGVRDAVEAGLIRGPRMHIAVVPLSPTGGHTDFTLPNGRPVPMGLPMDPIIDTDDDVRRMVRLLVRGGADVVKVCTTGGVSSPTDTPDDIGVPEEHVRLIVAETAKRSHQPVAAHAQGAEGIKAAIRGGAASIEHGYGIDDEGIDLMLEHGTFLVPTLTSALRVPDPRDVPAYLYEKKAKWSAIARERVAAALEAGVRTALGTDAGVCPHGQNLWEPVHAVELGLNPMEAIVAGTRSAAELLRLDGDIGTLEAGRLADLIIVDFDPITDITPLAEPDNVKAILQGGVLVKDRDAWFPDPPKRALISP